MSALYIVVEASGFNRNFPPLTENRLLEILAVEHTSTQKYLWPKNTDELNLAYKIWAKCHENWNEISLSLKNVFAIPGKYIFLEKYSWQES